jgi:hypothetical protein
MSDRHSQKRGFLTAVAVAIPAMLIGSGLSAPPAQAAYIVTLEQVGSNVVATGSGTLDLTDLTFFFNASPNLGMNPSFGTLIIGSPASASFFSTITGPANFGTGDSTLASSESGDFVSLQSITETIGVSTDYVSGSILSSSATWDGQTFGTLGVTPGTYEWTWGSGADADSFTLFAGVPVPAPLIGLPTLLAVGGLLFGAKLLGRGKKSALRPSQA